VKHRVIGVDLGTTYSAVAAYDPDDLMAEVIPDEDGNPTTPSVVSYDRGSAKVLVGWAAKRNLPNAPGDTIIEIKREMGEQEGGGEGRPTDGKGDVEARPPVKVGFASLPDKAFLPQEISAFILRRMKEIAEAEIGEEVRDAVITVPAYFKEPKRAATTQAVLLAGLYPRQLVAEPTAAAIAYGLDRGNPKRRAYLVFDLGGGTFDVSIIVSEAEQISVIAASGDARLGGGDFDNAITRWAIGRLKQEYGLDVAADPRARAQIKYHAEQAKIRLGAQQATELVLPELRPTEPPVLAITREQFIQEIRGAGTRAEEDGQVDLLRKSLDSVEDALNQAAAKGLGREDIDAVLLVGGSTKMPGVRAMLLDHFQKDEGFLRGDIDPAAVVARGAAIVGYRHQPTEQPFDIHREVEESTNPDAKLAELAPAKLIAEHSLGVGVQENRCVRMIERQTDLPTARTQEGFTNGAPVERLEARVFQGDGDYTYENTYIGSVIIDGLEPRPPGSYNFNVTYRLNRNGLLEVTVRDADSGRTWDARFEHGASVKLEAPAAPALLAVRPVEAREGVGLVRPYLDEDVQFTVYRPGTVEPGKWYPLLAFAHLSELRPEAEEEVHPLERVEQEARQVLGDRVEEFRKVTQDSRQAVPREGELTFAPVVPGIEVNPPSRSFLWLESVHREEFRLRTSPDLDGQVARGQMSVYLGSILLADIPLSIRVDSAPRAAPARAPMESTQARPYRKIFASYSHKDAAIVDQFASYVEGIGDTYLRDVKDLRAGEVWSQRLAHMIDEADVFQLFWSQNSMRSGFVRQEWEHALSLRRPAFVRPTYWEDPFPEKPDEGLPPEDLRQLHFQRIPAAPARDETEALSGEPQLARSGGAPMEAAMAGDAVEREDWEAAVFYFRSLMERAGAEAPPEIRRNLAVVLAHRAARDASVGTELINAGAREGLVSREGVHLLRRARADLRDAIEVSPALSEVQELLRRVEEALQQASRVSHVVRGPEGAERAYAAPASMRAAPWAASAGELVLFGGVLLIALSIVSLFVELPAPLRIGGMVWAGLLLIAALGGRGPWAIAGGIVFIGLGVVPLFQPPTPIGIGAVVLAGLVAVSLGVGRSRA